MNPVTLLFSYTGRINRAKWWLAILYYSIASLVFFILVSIVATLAEAFDPALGLGAALIAFLAFFVVLLISCIMVGIKRLHDRNKSGWWLLLFIGLPLAIHGVAFIRTLQGSVAPSGPMLLAAALSYAVGLWAIVEFGCLRGTVGPNKYGPDPPTSKRAA